MSFHPHLPAGAAKVGDLNALPPEDRFLVALFRGRPEARRDRDVAKIAGQLLGLMHSHGRRSLAPHHATCDCLGADEATFVEFIRQSANGAREDATLMALLLIRAEVAPLAVSLAEQLGLLIKTLMRLDMLDIPAVGGGVTLRMH